MKLLEPTGGKMLFTGEDVTHISHQRLEKYRRNVQMVFQDPYASMNPRFRIREVLEEPLIIHRIGENRQEREVMIEKALAEVRLQPPREFMARFPHMLSGGQRQRAATARSLILNPHLIVADEPVSMIDLSTRAEILHMMKEVQRDLQLTYLYITHAKAKIVEEVAWKQPFGVELKDLRDESHDCFQEIYQWLQDTILWYATARDDEESAESEDTPDSD